MAANPYDQFDAPNPYDQFDPKPIDPAPQPAQDAAPVAPRRVGAPQTVPPAAASLPSRATQPAPDPWAGVSVMDYGANTGRTYTPQPKPVAVPADNRSMLDRAVEAYKNEPRDAAKGGNVFSDLLPEYTQDVQQSVDTIKAGVNRLGKSASPFSLDAAQGALEVAGGGLGYLFAPATALATAAVGNPVERLTGVPAKYTDTAVLTAAPGVGLTPLVRRTTQEMVNALPASKAAAYGKGKPVEFDVLPPPDYAANVMKVIERNKAAIEQIKAYKLAAQKYKMWEAVKAENKIDPGPKPEAPVMPDKQVWQDAVDGFTDWGPVRPITEGATGLPDWAAHVNSAIQDLATKLGISGRVGILIGERNPDKAMFWGQAGGIKGDKLHAWDAADHDGAAIILNKDLKDQALPTAIHELGHVLDVLVLNKQPPEVREAINNAWQKAIATYDPKGKKTLGQYRPITESLTWKGDTPVGQFSDEYQLYLKKKAEWVAEQISRWLTTDRRPVGVVEKYFKGAADRWKYLYAKFTGHEPLTQEIRDFIEGQWRDDVRTFERNLDPLALDEKTGAMTAAAQNAPGGGVPPPPPGGQPPGGQPPGGQPPGGQPPGGTPPAGGTPLTQAPRARNMPPPSQYPNPIVALAKTIEKIFSPSTVDRASRSAANSFRKELGVSAQETSIASEALRKVRAAIDTADQQTRNDFIQYIETRSAGAANPLPTLQPLADAWKRIANKIETDIAAVRRLSGMNFIEDYFPHLWKNPQAAQRWMAGNGQGFGGFTKKRTLQLYADGLAAGLEPKYANPVDAMEAYIVNANRYLAHERIFQAGKQAGYIRYLTPKAAARLAAVNNLHPLKGRLSKTMGGPVTYQAYAPENFARVYNNMVDKGFQGALGDMTQALRRGANNITALELGLSGFHAFTTAMESIVGRMSNSMTALSRGRPMTAAGEMLKAPFAPGLDVLKGRKLYKEYLNPGSQSPLTQRITKMIAEAGGRPAKQDELYFGSERQGYLRGGNEVFRQALTGNFKQALKQTASTIAGTAADIGDDLMQGFRQGEYGRRNLSSAGVQALSNAFTVAGNTLDTLMSPLFKVIVPTLKNGAAYRMVEAFIEAHPNASNAEILEYTRRALDSIDNRFGEMVTDNVAYPRVAKEAGQILLRSGSYAYGQIARELGGGMADFLTLPFRKGGKATPLWTEKMSYLVAMPIASASLAAMTMYAMTGKWPSEIMDLYKPPTGGETDRGDPERLNMPGMMKELIEPWSKGFVEHFKGKMSTAAFTATELATNQDWKNQKIWYTDEERASHPRGNEFDPAALAILKHVLTKLLPITVRNLQEGQPPGSKITPAMTMFGFQRASNSASNPERAEKFSRDRVRREMNTKLKEKDRKEQWR